MPILARMNIALSLQGEETEPRKNTDNVISMWDQKMPLD
jgi:hypothetical protein